jgi:hypothetical protein
MSDVMNFEAKLADAFERYFADAPLEVDAAVVTAKVAAADRGRRVGWFGWLSPRQRQVALAFAVGLLVLALAATALVLIGRLQERPLLPWSYTNELVRAPNLLVPQSFAHATTLRDGRVLILDSDSHSAEVFDPADGSVRPAAKLADDSSLYISSLALLRDGRVLLVGDNRPGAGPQVANAQVFDPGTLEFHAVGPMVTPRVEAGIGTLGDGRALLIGGVPPNLGSWTPDDTILDVEAFDPATETFSKVAKLTHRPTDLPGMISLRDGRLVVFGTFPIGDPEMGGVGSVLQVFDPKTNQFTETGRPAPDAELGSRIPLNARGDVLSDGRLFIVGETAAPDGAATSGGAVIWDPATDSIQEGLVAAPWNPTGAVHLDDGRVFMVGATDDGTGAFGARTFDPRTGAITVVGPIAGCAPTPVRLRDGRVLLVGGMEDCQVHHPELGGTLAPAISTMQIFQ